MARKARGRDLLEQAKGYLSKAKTAEELRQAQAFVMPLEFGLSMEQTARAIGVSPGWACQLRSRFIRDGGIPRKEKPLRGGRRRTNMNIEEEKAFLEPFFDKAKEGGILVVSEINPDFPLGDFSHFGEASSDTVSDSDCRNSRNMF